MGERVTSQEPPDLSAEEATFNDVDIEQLKSAFEAEWAGNRRARTIVEHEDGSRTYYETYQVPLFKNERDLNRFLPRIGQQAMILGYTAPIGAVLVPNAEHSLTGSTYGSVFLFLERTEK